MTALRHSVNGLATAAWALAGLGVLGVWIGIAWALRAYLRSLG